MFSEHRGILRVFGALRPTGELDQKDFRNCFSVDQNEFCCLKSEIVFESYMRILGVNKIYQYKYILPHRAYSKY